MAKEEESDILVGGVKISHPEKVLFPDADFSKLELVEYYQKVSSYMIPYIIDRPVSLVRTPDGIEEQQFYQKHPGESFPKYIDRVKIKNSEGDAGIYISLDEVKDLIYLSNLSVIEYHSWGSRAKSLEKPDTIVFDLDPTPTAKWKFTIDTAKIIRDKLSEIGLRSFVKTSGKKGLHVMVPLSGKNSWEEVRGFAETFAKNLAAANPKTMTTEFYKKNRGDRVFIDWLRNLRGATSIAPYSVRVYKDAPVAVPVDWSEVTEALKPNQYNIKNLFRRLSALDKDPWSEYLKTNQYLP